MADAKRHITALKTVSGNTGRGIKSNARTTRAYKYFLTQFLSYIQLRYSVSFLNIILYSDYHIYIFVYIKSNKI